MLDFIEVNPISSPKASIIWLHGLGASGHDFEGIVPALDLPSDHGYRFIFPHAPNRPVTINGGFVMPAWYDILGVELAAREDETGLRETEQAIKELIEHEQALGIDYHNIYLAGFSQGGAVVLHTGLRYPKALGGIIALSTYLPLQATVQTEAHSNNRQTRIFMAHGTQDPVVKLEWSDLSQQFLKSHGYPVTWNTYPMEHQVCTQELRDLSNWLSKPNL